MLRNPVDATRAVARPGRVERAPNCGSRVVGFLADDSVGDTEVEEIVAGQSQGARHLGRELCASAKNGRRAFGTDHRKDRMALGQQPQVRLESRNADRCRRFQ